MPDTVTGPIDLTLSTGARMRIEAVTSHAFRVRMREDDRFPEPGLVRYGVVDSGLPDVPLTMLEDADALSLNTGGAVLTIRLDDGRVMLADADGNVLLEQVEAPVSSAGDGFRAVFALDEDERLYGLGDETRDRLNKRGHRTQMVLRNVTSYVPIPFLMSTGGWAIFMNSTWFHHLDIGADDPDRLVYSATRGELDYYIIAGETLPLLLDRYTRISGRPAVLPQWAYGLTWVCDERGVRARDVLYEAREFRQEGVPCDLIGLEPGWMETRYDFSIEKQWSTERFHQPTWKPHQDQGGFCAALKNMGFKLSLWLCCDYDLSEYEEQLLRGEDTEGTDDIPLQARDRYDEDVIRDPHFMPRYQDGITRAGEPWFEHLKKFVDNGADAFKMDGANQVCFHPDRKWANGMDDAEMHNLYPVLLARQMARGFTEYTGRRAMIYTAGGYAGIQQYAATWAGDTGGAEKPLVSLLNHALSGHSNTSCDMQVWNREGIHFGFMQPWSQILAWHQYNQPWFLPEEIYAIFKDYARLRYRLIPYLYSAAHEAARTGMPMMRPMPLVAADDPRGDEFILQYMLGDALLTCAFTDTIYLLEGEWIDYWTGDVYEGPREFKYEPPADKGGPLFVRAGAIIPTWPEVEYVGQKSAETVGLEIFPHRESAFTLYEDDGLTEAYLDGEIAITQIGCATDDNGVTLTIAPRQGTYDGSPERRVWEVEMHLPDAPDAVELNEAPIDDWTWDAGGKVLRVSIEEDPRQPVTLNVRR